MGSLWLTPFLPVTTKNWFHVLRSLRRKNRNRLEFDESDRIHDPNSDILQSNMATITRDLKERKDVKDREKEPKRRRAIALKSDGITSPTITGPSEAKKAKTDAKHVVSVCCLYRPMSLSITERFHKIRNRWQP